MSKPSQKELIRLQEKEDKMFAGMQMVLLLVLIFVFAVGTGYMVKKYTNEQKEKAWLKKQETFNETCEIEPQKQLVTIL